MCKAESDVDHQQTEHPFVAYGLEQIGEAVHEVTAINHLFTKSRQRPSQGYKDQRHFEVAGQITKIAEVALVMKYPDQYRLAYEELECFYQDACQNADSDCDSPIPIEPQSNRSPADATYPKRNPSKQEQKGSLTDRNEMLGICHQDTGNNQQLKKDEPLGLPPAAALFQTGLWDFRQLVILS
jgi:hypothetical protein